MAGAARDDIDPGGARTYLNIMAIRSILEVPDPRLRLKSKPVEAIDDSIRAPRRIGLEAGARTRGRGAVCGVAAGVRRNYSAFLPFAAE